MTDDRELQRTLARLNGRATGVAFGLLVGLSLMLATLILVAEGGANVGAHLALLAIFLPGYSVTVAGAFIGFVYGCVIGYALGRGIATIYNWAATGRDG
jgi:tetrahydromethanopterin S-methyltransferase subunit G